jgi:hypothetical protein
MGDEKADPTKNTSTQVKGSPGPSPDIAALFPEPGFAAQEQFGNAAVARSLEPASTSESAAGSTSFADPLLAAAGIFAGVATNNPRLAIGAAVRASRLPVIDLQGVTRFEPDLWLRSWISVVGPARVPVRFGNLAAGEMIVTKNAGGYQVSAAWLPVTHPDLESPDSTLQIGLAISIVDSLLEGKLSTMRYPPARLVPGVRYYVTDTRLHPILFGRSYSHEHLLKFLKWENAIRYGNLVLDTKFELIPPDGPPVAGDFLLVNERSELRAGVKIAADGLQAAELPLTRTRSGVLTGRQPIVLSQDWEGKGFKGNLTASYVDGSFDARGRVAFSFPKTGTTRLTGVLNVVVTSWDRAWEIANAQSPIPIVTTGIGPSGGGRYALTGWGTLNLVVAPNPAADPKNPGLMANAAFVVDPEGYVTARGILRVPREVTLVPAYDWKSKPLIDRRWELTDIPLYLLASLEVDVQLSVTPGATIGPVLLREVVVSGLYSTRPGVGSQLAIEGTFFASAAAWVRAHALIEAAVELGVELDLYFWKPEIDVDVVSAHLGIEAQGTLTAHAEARPKIELTQPGDPATGTPKYRISGTLDARGEIDLMLSITGGLEAIGLGGPSGSINLSKYPIADAELHVDIDHVVGSGEQPKVNVKLPKFNADKFVDDVIQGSAPKDTNKPVRGKFKDRLSGETKALAKEGAPPLPKLAKPGFELRVPFEMDEEPHELFLVVSDPPQLEMATGKREPVKNKVARARKKVADAKKTETEAGRAALREQQDQDLAILDASADAVEQETDALNENPTLLTPAEVPGVGEAANQLAEYGERYGDRELTGELEMTTAPVETTEVQAVQAVVPGTANPAGGFNLTAETPLLLPAASVIRAKNDWRTWERLVALPYVRTGGFRARAGVPGNLQFYEDYRIRDPQEYKEYKDPEGVFFDPNLTEAQQSEIVLVEATLNVTFFATNQRGRRLDTGEHKIDQIPRTLRIARALWPNARIRYFIICPTPPGETTADWLENQVLGPRLGFDPTRFSIEWIYIPVRERPPRA